MLHPEHAYEPHIDIHYKSLLCSDEGLHHKGYELPPTSEDFGSKFLTET